MFLFFIFSLGVGVQIIKRKIEEFKTQLEDLTSSLISLLLLELLRRFTKVGTTPSSTITLLYSDVPEAKFVRTDRASN